MLLISFKWHFVRGSTYIGRGGGVEGGEAREKEGVEGGEGKGRRRIGGLFGWEGEPPPQDCALFMLLYFPSALGLLSMCPVYLTGKTSRYHDSSRFGYEYYLLLDAALDRILA